MWSTAWDCSSTLVPESALLWPTGTVSLAMAWLMMSGSALLMRCSPLTATTFRSTTTTWCSVSCSSIRSAPSYGITMTYAWHSGVRAARFSGMALAPPSMTSSPQSASTLFATTSPPCSTGSCTCLRMSSPNHRGCHGPLIISFTCYPTDTGSGAPVLISTAPEG